MPIERCIICDEATGRAGRGDGSIYLVSTITEDTEGPFCEECANLSIIEGLHERSEE